MDSRIYISFIVPIYNVSPFLEDCVQSLCGIQNPRIEILLVDDGSVDCSPSICRKYAEKDGRVRVVTQDNQGVSMARNNGFMLAKGKWVCFVDGDDRLSDDFEDGIMGQIDEDMEVVYFGYQRMTGGKVPQCIDRGSRFMEERDLREAWLRILNRDIYRDSERFPDTILFEAPYMRFIKREKLLEWEIFFDKSLTWGEDLLYNFRLLQKVKKVKVIDRTGYYYRINEASITQRYDERAAERFFLLADAMGAEVEKAGDGEAARQYQVFVLKQLLLSAKRNLLNPYNPRPYCERRAEYRRMRHSEVVENALRSFPYGSVRLSYKLAIGIAATGSYGLLWTFYQMKRIGESVERLTAGTGGGKKKNG